jgi:tetratricopeptide (TPR) repeat protein
MAARVEKHPDNGFLRNELGNLLVERARLEEAVDQYRRAVGFDRGFAVAWNNLGVTLQAMGKAKAATRAFRQAIRASPTYALAHYNLGVNCDARGRYRRAIESYQKAIQLDPGLLDVRNNPRIVSNHHLAAVLVKAYLDRGGSVLLPVQTFYPEPRGKGAP